ncbi:TPA: hypothetical protein ACIYIL_005425, partial [Escherichia coli]
MTTITKERLLTIKQWRETYGPGSNVVLPAEEAEELARIALAALEVEPIGFRCRRNDNLGDWSYVYHREPDDFERKHLVIEGIYAAPPAPVVPEEKPMPNPLSMYAVDAVAAIAEVRGWNACRAAMLQAGNFRENKDSSTNNFRETSETSTNSPVIPDGLSTVCAEAYQVVGVMADALGVFGDAAVQKVLDNLSQQKLVHRDVLPFSL